jgi:hypothetical protein
MGHDVFGQNKGGQSSCSHPHSIRCTTCGTRNILAGREVEQRRLGNQYPQYTRKFSLGNGPADWVQEYMITKESGKMLGTLVALAVARMVNLETFIWDMPTGVLRDVWLALSSLQNKSPPGQCRLERVLVRWHDNSFVEPNLATPAATNAILTPPTYAPAGATLTDVGLLLPPGTATTSQGQNGSLPTEQHAPNRVEFPTLSVLPPLKSLSVLDIDELAYLDEMSILIKRSKDSLRELRVGISKKAQGKEFVLAWDGPGLHQVDHNAKWPGAPNAIGEMRLGGVLGILLGRVFDIRKKPKPISTQKAEITKPVSGPVTLPSATIPGPVQEEYTSDSEGFEEHGSQEGNAPLASDLDISQPPVNSTAATPENVAPPIPSIDTGIENILGSLQVVDEDESFPPLSPEVDSQPQHLHHLTSVFAQPRLPDKPAQPAQLVRAPSMERPHLDGKLRLTVLELERVPLSICVLQRAFDWSMITSLTILDCAYHENLWRMLRRQFRPRVGAKSSLATSSFLRQSGATNSSAKPIPNIPMEYQLNLKKIHTDFATPALIAFLKDTLAPNTLEGKLSQSHSAPRC